MNELFNMSELIMMGLVLFSSFFIFLFNYRTDNKEKYTNKWLILLDLFINMGMSITGYMLITVVFTNIPQLFESFTSILQVFETFTNILQIFYR